MFSRAPGTEPARKLAELLASLPNLHNSGVRILFLDDMETRYTAFARMAHGRAKHNKWVKTAEEAIAALDNDPTYDLVCLDHDLADEHYEAYHKEQSTGEQQYGRERTGYDVAIHIVTTLETEKQPRFAAVHSFNNRGASRISSALSEAGFQELIFVFPFSQVHYEKVLDKIEELGLGD